MPTPALPETLTAHVVVDDIAFAEGPTFDRQGSLYFVNYQRPGTIGRLTPEGDTRVWVETGGQANGLKCDDQGRIVCADYGGKRVTRFDTRTRAMEVLTDAFDGAPYLGPNDVALDRNGNIYFSDPFTGGSEEPLGAVYRIDVGSTGDPIRVRRLDGGVAFPNGLAVHPDGGRFFLAETGTNSILAYDLSAGGELTNKRTVVQFESPTVDGMMFDEHGRLWTARWVNGTVDVVDVDAGRVLASYATGERTTNITWQGTSAWVSVAGIGAIVRLDVGVRGYDPVDERGRACGA